MIKYSYLIAVLAFGILSAVTVSAQRVGFVSTDLIREQLPDARQADQRIKSVVEEWKRELSGMEKNIESAENEIKKNRLIWGDDEKVSKEKELATLKASYSDYSRRKFEPGGEYDQTVKTIMKPVEEKIYAAIQEVSSDEGFDLIWDKSVMPLVYTNFKYDLTVKVLKKLNVDVKKLEEELKDKIAKDPRNKKKGSKEPVSTQPAQQAPRSRDRKQSFEDPTKQPDQQQPQQPTPEEQKKQEEEQKKLEEMKKK